jgi:hypothetical protein
MTDDGDSTKYCLDRIINSNGNSIYLPTSSGELALITNVNAKLDAKSLTWTTDSAGRNFLVHRMDGQTQYCTIGPNTINMFNTADSNTKAILNWRGLQATRAGKTNHYCGNGIYNSSNYLLAIPDITSNKTIGLKEDIDAVATTLNAHTKRTGDWYNVDSMTKGQIARMGRMYVCTGSGITIKNADGSDIIATDNTNLSSSGHQAVAFILPNILASDGNYRCKMMVIDEGVLSPSFEAKDFLLPASATHVIIKATGGTSIWTV